MINTVKLDFKQLSDKEQIGNSEPFSVTNLPVYLINSEQIGISEQFFDDQKVPYMPSLTVHHKRLLHTPENLVRVFFVLNTYFQTLLYFLYHMKKKLATISR